jgi:ribonuclease HI
VIVDENKVTIYTDGACSGNPGPGGWGALLLYKEQKKLISGYDANTTNNKMELLAAIEGLKALKGEHDVILVTDSKYVMQGITEWIHGWKKKNWKTAAGKPVKNVDLWKMLDEQISKRDVSWQWVKGHSGDEGNEIVDQAARDQIEANR